MTFDGHVTYKDAFNGKNYTGGEGSYTGSTCHTADELPAENPNPPENADKPCKVGHSSGLVNGVRFCVPGSDITTDGPKNQKKMQMARLLKLQRKPFVIMANALLQKLRLLKMHRVMSRAQALAQLIKQKRSFALKSPAPLFASVSALNPVMGLKVQKTEKKTGGTFSGTCNTGFTCKEGDAISCAIAKRLHEDSCTLSKLSKQTEESSLYNQSKGKEGSVTGDLEGNESYGFSNIRSTSRFSASSCFQDLTVSVMGESLTIEFSKICPWLSNIGYVLVAVAWIIAATIVMRGRT